MLRENYPSKENPCRRAHGVQRTLYETNKPSLGIFGSQVNPWRLPEGYRPIQFSQPSADRQSGRQVSRSNSFKGAASVCRQGFAEPVFILSAVAVARRIVNLWDYVYNPSNRRYALRTGTQDANPRSYRAERRSQGSRGGAERSWRRERNEGIGSDCGRLLQALSEQGRAS